MFNSCNFRAVLSILPVAVFLCVYSNPSVTLAQSNSASAGTADIRLTTISAAILAGARGQAQQAVPYIMNYEVITYPGGDVSDGTGVCTDLVIRAFRHAGIDLQKEIHTDRKARLSAYPDIWDKRAADRNIDHRRCPNLVSWLRKNAVTLSTGTSAEELKEWRGGDIVFYVRKGATHPWHVGVVSDRRDSDGMPLIIDSYPPHTSESHRLDEFSPIHSHFRMTATRMR